jgi:hypothetical protein
MGEISRSRVELRSSSCPTSSTPTLLRPSWLARCSPSSLAWASGLAGRPLLWLLQKFPAGRHYQANAALAAAQWLDLPEPAAARTAAAVAEVVRSRDPALPERLRHQPIPGFRGSDGKIYETW